MKSIRWSGCALTLAAAGLALLIERPARSQAAEPPYQVAAYYFPNYHPGDARNTKRFGPAWSEWELVKAARPRFPGHVQPNVPLWGHTDESDPKAMAQKIDAAAENGLTAFIFDWYYYDDGPFLERGLEQGFMKAPNRDRLKFGLMWANHDWIDIFPYKLGAPRTVIYPGKITPATWDRMTDMVVVRYFKNPSYWLIDGKPYFSFYDLSQLLDSFGSVPATRAALDRFRAKTKAAGFPDAHLNAVVWGQPVLPVERTVADPGKLVADLGFDSVTSYVWIHHVPLNEQVTDFAKVQKGYLDYWDKAETTFKVPYYPNVSMGWDSSPRARQSDPFGNTGYPFTNTVGGNTPERFRAALAETKARLDKKPARDRIVTINSWNEWTEGSYLEPDTVHGLGYLEAIRGVFGK